MKTLQRTFAVIAGGLLITATGSLRAQDAMHIHAASSPQIAVPSSLNADHDEIHRLLSDLIDLGGKTGTAAREVARRLHVHFKAEERFALPALGLLSDLSQRRCSHEMEPAIAMTDSLRTNLSEMLAEHAEIVAALGALRTAGIEESHPAAGAFADKLTTHAQMEEQVFYPAALLAGERVAMCLKGK